jgi:hypothetical protein
MIVRLQIVSKGDVNWKHDNSLIDENSFANLQFGGKLKFENNSVWIKKKFNIFFKYFILSNQSLQVRFPERISVAKVNFTEAK